MSQRITWKHKARALVAPVGKLLVLCLQLVGLGLLIGIGTALAYTLIFAFFASPAHGAAGIPAQANRHKATLVQCARLEMGLSAPVALIAAQIHQESAWRETAVSSAGAQGLAQFMPATARWLPQVAPALRKGVNPEFNDMPVDKLPFSPAWALRAVCAYDRYLLQQTHGAADEGERWAFALRAYNGGLGWINKDRRKAASLGLDSGVNFGVVDTVNTGRSKANFAENTQYPRRIFALAPRYKAAGWGHGVPL